MTTPADQCRLDHIVWTCRDLAVAKREMHTMTGVAAVDGGSHPDYGTHNALLSLGQRCYLELLCPDPALGMPRRLGERLLGSPSGLYHWAVSSPDLSTLERIAREQGLQTSGVLTGSRQAPTGKLLEWRLLFLAGHHFGALLPFFIDWGQTPHPARSAPVCGELMSFQLASPQAAELRKLTDVLGVSVAIVAAATPSIEAEIATSRGCVVLSSAAPLAQGLI